MSYVYYNPNPIRLSVGDCVIRAISCALDMSWKEAYLAVCAKGLTMYDMPSANRVWGQFLKDNGFVKKQIPDVCPECYSVREFCFDNPRGIYVLGTGEHVVCVRDGNYFDSWDSGMEIPIYYFERR